MELYRLTGEGKVPGIIDFMENLLENDCKFLVFAHHKSVMNKLEEYAVSKKI